MQNKLFIILFLSLVLAVVFFSCSDRGNTVLTNAYRSSEDISPWSIQHEFDEELGFSMFFEAHKFRKVRVKAYTPPGYKHPNEGAPYPVLYMLSPYGETEEFYFNHGLQDVADRMIAAGEIVPMIIVCINGFYGNSWAGGRYVDIIGTIQNEAATGSLIDYMDNAFNTISDLRYGTGAGRVNRAISGVGMGGYGAVRIAVAHSENFSSVSAISAPLDFDGATGNGGFVPLFEQIIANLDTIDYEDMDTSYNNPLRTMVIAAATSFSPHDTAYEGRRFYPFDWQHPTDPQLWNADDTLRITDLNTYFEPEGPLSPLKYHLPFDANGDPYNPIWSLWLDNNIESIMAGFPGALDTTALLLITTPDAKYNFYQQTLDFSNYLTGQSIPHDLKTYTGYEGYDATGERFFYDILQDILKFHSEHFRLLD